jgi:hypothetical protein
MSESLDRSELDSLVVEWEARRPLLIEILTSMKEKGVRREAIGAGGFTLTFVLEGSGSMLIIQDAEGPEAVVLIPEVALDSVSDPLAFNELVRGIFSVVRLRAFLSQKGISSLSASGGYEVVADEKGLNICFPGGAVLIEADGLLWPRDVNRQEVYEAVARLCEAAEISREA